jgi:hypothetical protein
MHAKKLGSGGLGALVETHNSHDHLQRVYYIQRQTRKQSIFFWGEGGMTLLQKAAVLHFALTLFCSWELCPSQPADYWA